MGKHQIIYTSCKRGIHGFTDGMQIYSHDSAFNKSGSEGVKGLFAYQTPSLPIGVVMTEEVAATMPKAFAYRRLEDGSCAVVLNTYLGRDYMGSSGRFGNHLSHAIICDEASFELYPCEIYGSNSLLSQAPEGVQSANTPPFLPQPTLSNGGAIYVDSVVDFLATDNRLEIFKKMLAAMLAYKSAKKRVVICDSAENIIMWIAALHFAVPLKIALNVNFTTYEHDPSLSASRICGVLPEGTKYTPVNADAHFTFDFINNKMSNVVAEGDFYDFIDIGMSLSYDSVRDFHEFVRTRLTYSQADEEYCHIYSLYCLLLDGVEAIPLNTFKNAVDMANAYFIDKQKTELVGTLLKSKDFVLDNTNEYCNEIIKVLVSCIDECDDETQDIVKSVFVDKVASFFSLRHMSEGEFIRLYNEMEVIGNSKRIAIPFEFSKENNRAKLIKSMRSSSEQWQYSFVLDKFIDFIAAQGIVVDMLFMEHPMNKLIGSVLALSASNNPSDALVLSKRCLQKLSGDWKRFICMTFGIESILLKSQNSEGLLDRLWAYVIKFIAKNYATDKQSIYAFLLAEKKYEQIISIYNEWIVNVESNEAAKALFQEQLKIENPQYIRHYVSEICEIYYDFILNNSSRNLLKEEKELLDLLLNRSIAFKHMDVLVDHVLADFPTVISSEKHINFVNSIATYYQTQKNLDGSSRHYSGRLLILIAGMVFGRDIQRKSLEDIAKAVKASAGGQPVKLAFLNSKEVNKYIEWITPYLFRCSKTPNDLFAVYDLFEHTDESFELFVSICTNEALQEIKKKNSLIGVYHLLEFILNVGNDDDIVEIGKTLSKLNKQTLNAINMLAKKKFAGRDACLDMWKDVYGFATGAIPMPKKRGFFFGSRKK